MNALSRFVNQLGRFGLVGVFNTGIDFAVTNLLFILLQPAGSLGLLGISVAACAVATANSYWMNSRFTFQQEGGSSQAIGRFILVALVGLVVNSSVFLFVAKYLHLLITLDPLLTINIAKLTGVAVAMAVTFLGYRLGVFSSSETEEFRRSKVLIPNTLPIHWGGIGLVVLLGLAFRLGFLAMAPVVYGDAVNSSNLAWLLAEGRYSEVDTFWHSLYDFWQLPFLWLGFERYAALIAASLIPGLGLIVAIYLLGRRLYGESSGVIAALITALHPRLIEYSVNGYSESFYLCAATFGVYGLTRYQQGVRNDKVILAIALGLAGYFLVRNEALVLVLAVAGWLAFRNAPNTDQSGCSTGDSTLLKSAALAALLILVYVGVSYSTLGTSGLFSKSTVLTKQYTETLDLEAAARETYSYADNPNADPGIIEVAATLVARWPRNAQYVAERLPGVLLSPVVLFALALPLLARRRGAVAGDEIPLLLFSIWPLVFYPFIQLEPRLLFSTLIGVIVFGAAGLVASGRFISLQLSASSRLVPAVIPGLAGVLLLLLMVIVPILAWNSESQRGFHREIGEWIDTNLPEQARVAGDGYGYINSSTFWSGRIGIPRKWVQTPDDLHTWVADNSIDALIIYEAFLREANPELLPVIENGIPGLVMQRRFDFERVGWVGIWTPQ